MTCPNCKDAGCKVADAERLEQVLHKRAGLSLTHDVAWREARAAIGVAQSDCAHRAADLTNANTLARLAAIEARQDRIEAMLRAEGWM